MAYETKVILALLARCVADAGTVEEAYTAIVEAANVEDVQLPSYEELFLREKIAKQQDK